MPLTEIYQLPIANSTTTTPPTTTAGLYIIWVLPQLTIAVSRAIHQMLLIIFREVLSTPNKTTGAQLTDLQELAVDLVIQSAATFYSTPF
jgi:hypothetical protein